MKNTKSWKEIQGGGDNERRKGNFEDKENLEEIFIELKRISGYELKEIKFIDFKNEQENIWKMLSAEKEVKSIYEVGCGGGANLYLMEMEGYKVGGSDFSESLIEAAKKVLKTKDVLCCEAVDIPAKPKCDAVISEGVFGYFPDHEYAYSTLEKMYDKANYTMAINRVFEKGKEEAFYENHRKSLGISKKEYQKRYQGLKKLSYSRELFENFAKEKNMHIKFAEDCLKGFLNSEYTFSCYMYK